MGDAGRPPIAIAGAGAAGLAASLACARSGQEVILLDPRPHVGGTVTHALIHTLGGCLDSSGAFIAGPLCRELIERLQRTSALVVPRRHGRTWTYSVPPQLYGEAVTAWLAEEPRIHLQLGCRPALVDHRCGWIQALRWETADGGCREQRVSAAIDCSGDAGLTRLVDPHLVEDADTPAASGVILVLGGVDPQAVRFPRSLAINQRLRAATAAGLLPAACAQAWCDVGPEPGQAYVKFAIAASRRAEQDSLAEMVHKAAETVAQTLRNAVPGCEHAHLHSQGSLGQRDGGGIVGVYRLLVEDVRSGRTWSGDGGRCSWPIEYWSPSGGVTLEHLAPMTSYEIPLGALQVQGMGNLLAAGRCLSAEPLARASARVVGSCWTMGERAGRAAAALVADPASRSTWLSSRTDAAMTCAPSLAMPAAEHQR